MSNVDWDTKLVIGSKAKAPVVTRKVTDLNGKHRHPDRTTVADHAQL